MPSKELSPIEKIDRAIDRAKQYIHILYISIDRNKSLDFAEENCDLALTFVQTEMDALLSKKAEIESLKSQIVVESTKTEEEIWMDNTARQWKLEDREEERKRRAH